MKTSHGKDSSSSLNDTVATQMVEQIAQLFFAKLVPVLSDSLDTMLSDFLQGPEPTMSTKQQNRFLLEIDIPTIERQMIVLIGTHGSTKPSEIQDAFQSDDVTLTDISRTMASLCSKGIVLKAYMEGVTHYTLSTVGEAMMPDILDDMS